MNNGYPWIKQSSQRVQKNLIAAESKLKVSAPEQISLWSLKWSAWGSNGGQQGFMTSKIDVKKNVPDEQMKLLVIKTNEIQYFSIYFDKGIYLFRTDLCPSSGVSTPYTARSGRN